MNEILVKVPDIGDFHDVAVIELLVKPGDTVKPEQSLITVESDKASMEIPSTGAGVVKTLLVKLGDKVNQGSPLVLLLAPASQQPSGSTAAPTQQGFIPNASPLGVEVPLLPEALDEPRWAASTQGSNPSHGSVHEVRVPDIGDFHDVTIIEVFVKPGDFIKLEQSLITVESDKASMEIPSSAAGVIQQVMCNLGDKVNRGDLLALVQTSPPTTATAQEGSQTSGVESAQEKQLQHSGTPELGSQGRAVLATQASSQEPTLESQHAPQHAPPTPNAAQAPSPTPNHSTAPAQPPTQATRDRALSSLPYASPSVRKFARELGVPLSQVQGSGPKGRILHQDIQSFTQAVMQGSVQTQAQTQKRDQEQSINPAAPASNSGASVRSSEWTAEYFAKFGPITEQPLTRIKQISATNLHLNWVTIPHVTNNDEADITTLESFRKKLNKESDPASPNITMLAFVIKACVAALKKYPHFNASFGSNSLYLKGYYHIGFAVDTPNGLLVPVLKDADRKGVGQIAQECAELAARARSGKLPLADMKGGCFTITSLGSIGGTHFTPIINAPEVAILGLSRAYHKPIWDGTNFIPRLMLPLSLSYDHRAIDGAAAAHFNAYLGALLADMRRVLL